MGNGVKIVVVDGGISECRAVPEKHMSVVKPEHEAAPEGARRHAISQSTQGAGNLQESVSLYE
jgi:hypothetical protein